MRLHLLAALVALVSPAFASLAWSAVIVIKAGRLLDPASGAVTLDQTIVVNGRTIERVGTGEPIPEGADVVDLSKSTVMPGLIDCHTHMCAGQISRRGLPRESSGLLYLAYDLGNTSAYRALQGAGNARTMLESGFTTIRDVGNSGNYADTDLRRAIEEGLVPGPTMITAGRIIAPFGGQYRAAGRGYTVTPERPELISPEYFDADTHDEMTKAIHRNIFHGALVIKIVVDDQRHLYSVDDIRHIIQQTRRAGLKVAAHCVTERGARNAAEAGVDSIEHGFNMSDDTLRIAKQNNVVLVGTDFTADYLQEYAQDDATRTANHAKYVDRIKRAHAIGVTMAFGSDIIFDCPPRTRGQVSLSIVDSYVEAQLPRQYILQMVTANAARLLGVEKERGAIAAGQAADIVAMPGNPLDDLAALKGINFVMREGKVARREK